MDSSEKVNFMGFLKMVGFFRIYEIYDSYGEMNRFCYGVNFSVVW